MKHLIALSLAAAAVMMMGCGNNGEEEPEAAKTRALSMSHGDNSFTGTGFFNVGPITIASDYPINRIYLRTTQYVTCDDYYGRDALDITVDILDDTKNTGSYFECAQTQAEADNRAVPIPVCSEIETLRCFDTNDPGNFRYHIIGCYPDGFSHLERRVTFYTGGGEEGECVTAIAALEGEDPATGERALVISKGSKGFYLVNPELKSQQRR